MIANSDFNEALKVLSERELIAHFQEKLNVLYKTIGQLSEKELTLLQERVNVLVEMREEFISIRNQPTNTK